MPPTLPSLARVFVTAASARGRRIALAAALALAACGRTAQPPVTPGEPIPAAPEVELGSMDAECERLLAAMATYQACPNLDDDERYGLAQWGERAQRDFAAGKKANPDANAQHAIAAACHKAVATVAAATERCHAGPRPEN